MRKNLVRLAQKEQGMSGEALARLVEMSASDLSKLERGLLPPYRGWRERIADALQVPEGELFPEEVSGNE